MNQIWPEINMIKLEDAELQYLHYPSDGPTLILLHATGLLPWLWHPIARSLYPRYRIIAPYFCDHRTCEPEEGGLSWEILAKDLAALCERLSLQRPYLVGHSMGGTVVTIAHASEGLQAEKIVLIEPIFLPRSIYETRLTVETHPLASRSIKRRNAWDTEEDARSYLRSRKMFEKWDDEMLDLYIRFGMVSGEGGGLVLACHPRREASIFMGGMQFNPWPVIPMMRCPVLVIEGEASENRSFIDLPAIAAAIPKGQYHMVAEAGHLVPQEHPAETARIIDRFFGT